MYTNRGVDCETVHGSPETGHMGGTVGTLGGQDDRDGRRRPNR
jgi:hypothetical protein